MTIGTFGALVLFVGGVFLVCVIMNAKYYHTYLYDNTSGFSASPRVFWDYLL